MEGRVERLEQEMGGLREEVVNMMGDFDVVKVWIEEMRET